MPDIRGVNFSLDYHAPLESISFSEQSLAFLHTTLDEDIKPINAKAKIGRIVSCILFSGAITEFILGFGSASAIVIAFNIISGIVLILCAVYLLLSLVNDDKSTIAQLIGKPDYHIIKDYLKDRPHDLTSNIRLDVNNREWEYVRTCLTVLFPRHEAEKEAEKAKKIKEATDYNQEVNDVTKNMLGNITDTNMPFQDEIMTFIGSADDALLTNYEDMLNNQQKAN